MKTYFFAILGLIFISAGAQAHQATCLNNAKSKIYKKLNQLEKATDYTMRAYVPVDRNNQMIPLLTVQSKQSQKLAAGDTVYPTSLITDYVNYQNYKMSGGYIVVRCDSKNPLKVDKVWKIKSLDFPFNNVQAKQQLNEDRLLVHDGKLETSAEDYL